MANITLTKLLTMVITATIIALLRHIILEPKDPKDIILFVNGSLGILSPILGLGIFELLSEYLGIKGEINLEQFLFGMDTMGLGNKSTPEVTKSKLYNAMDSDTGTNSGQKPDKGKGIDSGTNGTSDSDGPTSN